MAKTIKYTGSADNYAEIAVTGKQSVWQVGQQEERSDADATLLLATGQFRTVAHIPVMYDGAGSICSEENTIGFAGSGIAYDSQGRVSAHDGWTVMYDASGRVASQTNGTRTQTFAYDSAGRYTGYSEA